MLRYLPITGRLYLSDDTESPAHVIFDTDEPFLCVKPQDFKAGSQVVPARTASSSGVDGTQTVVDIEKTYLLATIDIPGAKVVRGMMRSTWVSNPEPADNLWRQASGTHLDILDGVSQTGKPQSDIAGYDRVATMGGYTFEVNGLNQLIMRERIVMRARDPGGPPTTFNRARQQATISFRLLIGFFLDQDFTPKPVADIVDTATRSTTLTDNNQDFTCSFGFPFAGRRLVLFTHRIASGTGGIVGPDSVTIGGVSATLHGEVSSAANYRTRVWSATVPTGASGTVRLSASWGSHLAVGLELYAVGGVTGAPTVTTGTSAGATASCAINVGATAIGLVASTHIEPDTGTGGDATWTNVTQKVPSTDIAGRGRMSSGIVSPGAGSLTASAQWGSADPTGIIAARFSM